MASLDKVLYTAHAHTTGGRDGESRTDDGRLAVRLTPPGAPGNGTNPEQLFAAGYSACFIGAMKAVAGKQKITLPADLSVDAEVDLGPVGQVYGIAVRMTITLPGMDKAAAQALVGDRLAFGVGMRVHVEVVRTDELLGRIELALI